MPVMRPIETAAYKRRPLS